jgi:hypothetical protein
MKKRLYTLAALIVGLTSFAGSDAARASDFAGPGYSVIPGSACTPYPGSSYDYEGTNLKAYSTTYAMCGFQMEVSTNGNAETYDSYSCWDNNQAGAGCTLYAMTGLASTGYYGYQTFTGTHGVVNGHGYCTVNQTITSGSVNLVCTVPASGVLYGAYAHHTN